MLRLSAALAASFVAACSSIPAAPENDVDQVRVAQIENAAKRYGTQVIWLNYPRKPAPKSN